MYRRAVAEIKKYHISALHLLLRMNHGRHLRYGQKLALVFIPNPLCIKNILADAIYSN